MKLKSLEIYGFKSFADKTVMTFGDGITAVVGPNGSGKSNISDAVCWVMGEQSNKTLRSQKMENVIFSGTQKRKQMGYAEVTLVIDNSDRQIDCDSDEVSVTRRLYRSGESEYKLNNATVRLKDVHELFMDTGLGRDGYSIVGQGKIDNIVASKTSQERREIFEEAAGISKYRHRKIEAERKLKSAEENLVRLRDILTELESRVGPLKSQSQKAQKFLELAKEQEYLQIGLWINSISKYKDQLREQELKIIAAKEQYDEITSKSVRLDDELEESTETMQKLIVLADQAQKNSASFEEQAAVIDGEIAVENNTIFHNNATVDRLKNDIESLNSGDSSIYAEIEQKKILITQNDAEISSYEEELRLANEQLLNLVTQSDSFFSQIEQLNAKLNKMSVDISNFLVIKMSAQSAKEELDSRLLTVNEAILQKREKQSELKEEKKLLNSDLENCEDKINECNNILKGRRMLLESQQDKVNEHKAKIDKLYLDSEEKYRRAQILEDLEKSKEGFSHAIKTVLASGKERRLSGIHGTVYDLIKVKKEYAVAIEVALGNNIQNIITETINDAKTAMNMLKSNKSGRATFLPLDSVKPRLFKEEGLEDFYGYIGIADELVEFDKKYKDAISNLLGGIVVAEDIDSAITIAKKNGYRFKIVTIDGQVVNAGGSLTGGSLSKNAGMLSRSNDIAEFKAKAEQLKAEAEKITLLYDKALSELASQQAEITNCESELKTAEEDKIRVLGELKRINEQIELAENDVQALENEKNSADVKIAEFDKSILESDSSISLLENESATLKVQLEELTGGRDTTSAKREEINAVTVELRSKIFESKKTKEVYENSIRDLTSLIDGQAQKAQSLNDEIVALGIENERIEQKIAILKQKAEQMRVDAQNASNSVKDFHLQRDNLERETHDKRTEQKNIIETRERLNGELVRLEERKVTMVHNYDDIIQKLFDEYGLTKSEAEEKNIVIENISEAQLRLSELKRSIKSLGSVNVSAIEEYKEVSERYEYMSEQISDVENTRDELYKLINKLVEQMQSLFSERFVSINAYFQKIFSVLFGGGSAELKLTDPENVLESGIDILAQPPGKNITIIEQLSGGEKALVAISIYFAVMKVNPPPFCILDEVDAALDDVNVTRFAEYLRKMTVNTQYILITHRRGSMEEADVLYGVTMQEKGVTKMLELNVAEAEKNLSQN